MKNPILETLANAKSTGNAIKAASELKQVSVPTKPKLSKFKREYLNDIAEQQQRETLFRNDSAPASVDINNTMGINPSVYRKVDPYIRKYNLQVIDGYRDKATASDKSATNSSHYTGDAMDTSYGSMTVPERLSMLGYLRTQGSVGVGHNSFHYDSRPGRLWTYKPDGSWTSDMSYAPKWYK